MQAPASATDTAPAFVQPPQGTLAAELGLPGVAPHAAQAAAATTAMSGQVAGMATSGTFEDMTGPSFTLAMEQAGAPIEAPRPIVTTPSAFTTPAIQSGPTKLFVGSVPAGTTQQALHDEFAKFGPVAEIFLKSDAAEAGRMWGFVTYVSPDGAAAAVAALNEQFVFPGATRPLAVSFARSSVTNSTGAAEGAGSAILASAATNPGIPPQAAFVAGPTKLFIGSVPGGTTREALQAEFEKFGVVMDVFLKNDRDEPSRMWGFITYADSNSAAAAVSALHERLVLPGGSRPCAVSFARNSQAQHSMAAQSISNPGNGTTKLFIGTIPVGTTEAMLRREFERFGQVTEVFLKHDGANEGRMWGFLSYADAQAAAVAVSSLHEKLMLPGSVRPCAVSFARQSSNPRHQKGGCGGADGFAGADGLGGAGFGAQLDWKVYYTAQGLPYYHCAATGVTQWECPPELGGPPAGVPSLMAAPTGAANTLYPGGQTATAATAAPEVVMVQQPGYYGATSVPADAAMQGVSGQPLRYSPY